MDDNEDVLELIRRYLGAHGYRVIGAGSAQDALEKALRSRPDAIAVDLMMPKQDGWDLLQSLRNQPALTGVPIIVCSVLNQRELALSLGASAYLQKPITEESLVATLRSLLEP